jgi:Pheromone A receptor
VLWSTCPDYGPSFVSIFFLSFKYAKAINIQIILYRGIALTSSKSTGAAQPRTSRSPLYLSCTFLPSYYPLYPWFTQVCVSRCLLAHNALVPHLALAVRHFILRRISFAAHLENSKSALTTSRYLRLMLMSAVQMVWSVTITSYTLWFTTISIPMRPWTNWADVHSDWLRIDTFATLFTPQKVITTYYILWWTVPASTIIFVAFFAFSRSVLEDYQRYFMWFRTRVLRMDASNKPTQGSLTKAIGYDCLLISDSNLFADMIYLFSQPSLRKERTVKGINDHILSPVLQHPFSLAHRYPKQPRRHQL